MSRWADDDSADARWAAPDGADCTCAECGRPCASATTTDGLCVDCCCAGCGAPAAPIEHDGHRLCRCCAEESGYVRPLNGHLEAAE